MTNIDPKFLKEIEDGVEDMFRPDISEKDANLLVLGQIEDGLKKATVLNDEASSGYADKIEEAVQIKQAQSSLSDIDKQQKVREELDIAA